MEQGTSPRRHLASAPWIGFLKQLPRVRLLLGLLFACSPMLEAADSIPSPDSTNQPVASPMAPAVQDPSSKTDQGLSQADAVSPETTEKKDPLTPENANLNLASDLELETLDTREKVFLPAGTYRQILQIPIDSPTMRSAQKMRQERRPEVKVAEPLSPVAGIQKKPLWIRYESLEKIRINEEERRGGLDVPAMGPRILRCASGMRSRRRPTRPAPSFILSSGAWGIPPRIFSAGRQATPGKFRAILNTA